MHQCLRCNVVMITYFSLQEFDLSELAAEALNGGVAVNSKVEHMFCLFADIVGVHATH